MPSSSSSSSSSENESSAKAHDERTPLLAAAATAPSTATAEPAEIPHVDSPSENEDLALPRLQIFLLCYCRVVEPIAFFTIFPYINFMIESVGSVQTEEVGFYSGLIESLFSATQMCVMIFWGKAADRLGRKPVLIVSLYGIAVTTALFGMSQSLWQMILFRCMAGVFAGTVVTIRAMITENSTKKTQAKAFSYFAFAGNLGVFLGPLIGGALERPADKYKSTFGRVQFFIDNPYALPGFVTTFLSFSAAIISTLFLKETLHLHHDKKSNTPPLSTWQLFRYPGVRELMGIYNYVFLLAFAFTAVNPVFQYTRVDLGGLGFPPGIIAAMIGLGGASQAIWLLFAFPPLHKRIGTGGILRLCAWVWPVFFAIDPLGNVLLRFNLKVVFWVLFILNNIFGSGVAMAFTAAQLAINDIAPSHETIGTLNALVLALQSGLRAVVPAISTSIFAIGVKYHIAWGQLFWIVLTVVSFGLRLILEFLPEEAEGRPQQEEEGDV